MRSAPLRWPSTGLTGPLAQSPASETLLHVAKRRLSYLPRSKPATAPNASSPHRRSFFADARARLRATPIVWYSIPVGLGAAVLVLVNARKQARRAQGEDDETLGPNGVRVKGPWQVHVIGALPLRTISRMYGAFNSVELPVWFRVPGYRFYSWIFGANLDECDPSDLREYRSMSEFFMRKLKPGLRIPEDAALLSPADGRVVQFGQIRDRRISSVKGATYSMDALLGGVGPIITNPSEAERAAKLAESEGGVDEQEFASLNGIEYSLDQLIGDEEHAQGQPPDEPKEPKRRWYNFRRRFSSKAKPASADAQPRDASIDASEQPGDAGGPSSSIMDHASVAIDVAKSGNMPWTVKGVPKDGHKMFYAVVYLAPGDYHRFHSPAAWIAERRRHFAGELFSVSPWMVGKLQDLFILNERVALLGRWRYGFFSFTAVGATNVGSIRINFDRDLRTNLRDRPTQAGTFEPATYANASKLLNGQPLRPADEIGGFWLGSTIVLVFEAPEDFEFKVSMGEKVRVGQALGDVRR